MIVRRKSAACPPSDARILHGPTQVLGWMRCPGESLSSPARLLGASQADNRDYPATFPASKAVPPRGVPYAATRKTPAPAPRPRAKHRSHEPSNLRYAMADPRRRHMSAMDEHADELEHYETMMGP